MKATFSLHPAQQEVYDHPARFKVVAAGRRFGKTYLAAITLILAALQTETPEGKDLSLAKVYYIAPTFTQGKEVMWSMLKKLCILSDGTSLIELAHENTATITLINGRTISIKGADRPDTLRGAGLYYAVLDEYADMKPHVWEEIIRPALADYTGSALFIGTPKGKNHFYEVFMKAMAHEGAYADWQAFQFDSLANTTLDPDEIAKSIGVMSVATARQEFGANFNSGGGECLQEKWWRYGERPAVGNYYIAVDLAGFTESGGLKKGVLKMRDEHAICIAKCNEDGWFVEEILTGQWDVRETAIQIVKAYRKYRPIKLGIETGALKNACGPYLEDYMKEFNSYFLIHNLAHGGRKKADRIRWALQGRLERDLITLNKEEHNGFLVWQQKLIAQATDFPSSLSHDDMIDALAYIDQLTEGGYGEFEEIDTHEVFDDICGY